MPKSPPPPLRLEHPILTGGNSSCKHTHTYSTVDNKVPAQKRKQLADLLKIDDAIKFVVKISNLRIDKELFLFEMYQELPLAGYNMRESRNYIGN